MFTKQLPDGSSVSGYRTLAADVPLPLLAGVIAISQDVKARVRMEESWQQESEDNASALSDVFKLMKNRHLG